MADEPRNPTATRKTAARAPAEGRDPLASLRDEMERLFDDFSWRWPGGPMDGRGLVAPLSGSGAGFLPAPAVDMVDLEKEVQVRAELPGMAEKDIDIEISGNMLTIRGEKKEEAEKGEKGGKYYMSERRYGSFERTLRIPEGADRDKAEARFAQGVLTVTFPKTKEARQKAKKIKVTAG